MTTTRRAIGIAGLAVAGSVSVATPASAEPPHWVGTSYIYTYDSTGLKACEAYGLKAADQHDASNGKCSTYAAGDLTKYRIQVLVR